MSVSSRVPVHVVKCLLCGRVGGQIVGGRFVADPHNRPPVVHEGGSRCGECLGSLYLEPSQAVAGVAARYQLSQSADVVTFQPEDQPAEPDAEADIQPTNVVSLRISDIAETPTTRNSRLQYDEVALEELAASIRLHGLLQPIVVRPTTPADAWVEWETDRPTYIVIAGNRRLRAARRSGLKEIACVVRVAGGDEAFVLNVVENLQRRGLSGRERVRAIVLLANLTDDNGTPLGVRAISRRTGLSPATVSLWLRIDRRAPLKAALAEDRLDIGRAMILARAPDADLPDLLERASGLPPRELARIVAGLKGEPRNRLARQTAANERHAQHALQALLQIDSVPPELAATLARVQQRVDELLASQSDPTAPPS